ncbi:hypothetical protein [Streptomyces sp. NPDC046862]|uniref:hypothetical protein n=1 Tax=Streptomyces sp. NPDC046862 TaxID=3154603 RepID=UPI0034552FAF
MVVATPQLKGCDGLQHPGEPEAAGLKKLTHGREACLLIMRQGLSNTGACRIRGINRRTGKRWRYGTDPTGGHIADRLREKASVRQDSTELGRSLFSISRETRRT